MRDLLLDNNPISSTNKMESNFQELLSLKNILKLLGMNSVSQEYKDD